MSAAIGTTSFQHRRRRANVDTIWNAIRAYKKRVCFWPTTYVGSVSSSPNTPGTRRREGFALFELLTVGICCVNDS